jgi:hypothetical protein
VGGKQMQREDEAPRGSRRAVLLRVLLWVSERYGRFDPARWGPQFKYPYFMAAGTNVGITAELYERTGGYPRRPLEQGLTDRVLSETVRTLTTRAALRPEVIVYASARRVWAYGALNTLRWYRNQAFRDAVVDVR